MWNRRASRVQKVGGERSFSVPLMFICSSSLTDRVMGLSMLSGNELRRKVSAFVNSATVEERRSELELTLPPLPRSLDKTATFLPLPPQRLSVEMTLIQLFPFSSSVLSSTVSTED